jgi:hypothetical protein
MAKLRKPIKHGSRITFYVKDEFPQEMLDWMNGQSDLPLLFDYALERLFQEVGYQDIASLLPRNYQVGKGIQASLKGTRAEIPVTTNNHVVPNKTEPKQEEKPPGIPNEQESTKQPEKQEQTKKVEQPQKQASVEKEDSDIPDEDIYTILEQIEEESPKEEPKKVSSGGWAGLDNLDDNGYY